MDKSNINDTVWTLCSEKLPNKRDWYLGIFMETETGWINLTPFICDYVGHETAITTNDFWILKEHDDEKAPDFYYYQSLECIAWAQLPEQFDILTCNKKEENMQHIVEDTVNHPSHYADHCSIECIDAIELALGDDGAINYCLGNAIKYLWRCKYKNGIEDLNKAEWYLNRVSEEDRYNYTTLIRYTDMINYLQRLHKELLNKLMDNEIKDEEINI